ncbi:hypothetical protein TRSC58_04693 [Trypanosoma rangeli SC58]|uniref:Uncharacterized protein n=1 Tax=Trypanosoma rangeli SC58 TaxID=429131 RepID=A0A061IZZ7_TRYRA|nr:hypothetical protein TRSC58_04693 [Trypanosoma rangeli SC58]
MQRGVALFCAIIVCGVLLCASFQTMSCTALELHAAPMQATHEVERDGSRIPTLWELLRKLRLNGWMEERAPLFDIVPLSEASAICDQILNEGNESALVLVYAPQLFPQYDYAQLLPLLAGLAEDVRRMLESATATRQRGGNASDLDNVAALFAEHRFRVLVVDASLVGEEPRFFGGERGWGGAPNLASVPLAGRFGRELYGLSFLEVVAARDDDNMGDLAHSHVAELLKSLLTPKGHSRGTHTVHPTVLLKLRQGEQAENTMERFLLREVPPLLLCQAAKAPMYLLQTLLRCRSATPCSPVHEQLALLGAQRRCGCIGGPESSQELLQFVTGELQQMSLETLRERRQAAAEKSRRRSWRRIDVSDAPNKEALLAVYDVGNDADDVLFNAPIQYAELKEKTDEEVDREYVQPMLAKIRFLHQSRDAVLLREARQNAEVVRRVRSVLRESQTKDLKTGVLSTRSVSLEERLQGGDKAREEEENHLLLMEYQRSHAEAAKQLRDNPFGRLIRHLSKRMDRIDLLRKIICVNEGRGTAADEMAVRLHTMHQEHQWRLENAERLLRDMRRVEGE